MIGSAIAVFMVKTKRSRVKVIKMLAEHQALEISKIFDFLNDSKGKYGIRNGCTMARLNNILSKESVFVRAEKDSQWMLDFSVLENDPELADHTVNSFLRNGPK